MKKLLAGLLAALLVFGAAVPTLAETQTEGSTGTAPAAEEGNTIRVDIAWEKLEFVYSDTLTTYDPVSHTTTTTPPAWTADKKAITVSASGDNSVEVDFGFTATADTGIVGTFYSKGSDGSYTALTADEQTIALWPDDATPTATGAIYLGISGSGITENTALGSVSVVIRQLPFRYNAATETYTVRSAEGLLAWGKIAAEATDKDEAVNLVLDADITLTGENNWTPLGGIEILDDPELPPWESTITHRFTGTIDGNGHTITGLHLNGQITALVNYLGPNGVIRNLSLADVAITGTSAAAAFAANCGGTVENCHVLSGTISSDYTAGGIAARITYGRIIGCTNAADVTCSSYGGVGGIVGNINNYEGTAVIGCFNSGTITCTEAGNLCHQGGIAGVARGNVVACGNTGTLVCSALPKNVGGIAGYASYLSYLYGLWTIDTAEYDDDSQVPDPKNGLGEFYPDYVKLTACYAGSCTQTEIDAMNAAIAAYNEGKQPTDATYCAFTWELDNGAPALKRAS